MFTCPHCEKPGISPLRKVILSPGLQATCSICGGASSTRYASWLSAVLPGSLLLMAGIFVESNLIAWSLNIFGLLLIIIVPLWFAPLHKDE